MPVKNPWKKLSSKQIYKNNWIRLREDQVIQPDGNEGIYSVVETSKACGVVALTEDNEIFLVGQFRYPTNNYSWEIIEGGSELNEDPLDCCKRELKEEAGLIAQEWEPLGPVIHLSNSHSDETAWLYIARGLTQTKASPDPTEILSIKKVSLPEANKMVESGDISDAMSIIALSRLEKVDLGES